NNINGLFVDWVTARDGCRDPLKGGAVLLAPSLAWQAQRSAASACRQAVACGRPSRRGEATVRFRGPVEPRASSGSEGACIAVTPTCPSARQTPPASPLG